MGAITRTWVGDLESRMRVITGETYDRLNSNLWYPKVTSVSSSTSRREILTWLLSTAQIEWRGEEGGHTSYEDLVMRIYEYTHNHAGAGFRIHKDKLTDTDGGGVALAAKWSTDIGAYMAYWPQKQSALALKEGHLAGKTSYDGEIFFSNAHPLNPYNTGAGTYSNIHTAGSGAGAVPIDHNVTVDVALINLESVMAYVRSIKMPNGEDPRMLRVRAILCGAKLAPRAAQLTNAKFIAQAAAAGGGSADVEALIQTLGYAEIVVADELNGFESDTTYFVICDTITDGELGGLVYSEREPFAINYYTGDGGGPPDWELQRMKELAWEVDGRNALVYGHPFSIHKCKAA